MGHRQMEGTEAGCEDRVRTERKRKGGVRHGIDRNREDRIRGSRERNIEGLLAPDLGQLRQRFPSQDRVTALRIVSERAHVP